jgi:hypothetical protein
MEGLQWSLPGRCPNTAPTWVALPSATSSRLRHTHNGPSSHSKHHANLTSGCRDTSLSAVVCVGRRRDQQADMCGLR